eukprot:Gb_02089 [translate_table: standard]
MHSIDSTGLAGGSDPELPPCLQKNPLFPMLDCLESNTRAYKACLLECSRLVKVLRSEVVSRKESNSSTMKLEIWKKTGNGILRWVHVIGANARKGRADLSSRQAVVRVMGSYHGESANNLTTMATSLEPLENFSGHWYIAGAYPPSHTRMWEPNNLGRAFEPRVWPTENKKLSIKLKAAHCLNGKKTVAKEKQQREKSKNVLRICEIVDYNRRYSQNKDMKKQCLNLVYGL